MDATHVSRVRTMVECALMIAIGTVLAQIKLYELPNGGAITAVSMLPFILVSFRHGVKWGLLTGLANSLLQMLLGGVFAPPTGSLLVYLGMVLLDYVLAFTVLGLANAFARPFGMQHRFQGILFGTFIVCLLRFCCSFVSGFLIWGSIVKDGWGAVSYSLMYNGSYMLPETILTVLGAVLLYKAMPQAFSSEE